MSRCSSLTALALVLLGCGRLSAQQVPYGQGRWESDSTGIERAVVYSMPYQGTFRSGKGMLLIIAPSGAQPPR